MTEPLLHTIPTCTRTAAQFLDRYERATPEEVSQIAERIAGMTENEFALFEHYVIPLCFNESLLELVCASPELVAHTSYLRVSSILIQLYKKQDSLLMEPDVYDRLTASLINLYPNTKRINFLESLHQIVRVSNLKPHRAGPLLDEALANHAENSPSKNFAGMARAMDNLRDIVLPKTLGVFIRQCLAKDEFGTLNVYVAELFQLNNLHDAYVPVFMNELGRDAFLSMCIEAQHVEPCLASVIKLIPFVGEEAFHDAAFFEAQLKALQGAPSHYLKDFLEMNPDQQQIPLLTQFVLDNLELMLAKPLGMKAIPHTLGVVQIAVHHGLAEKALSLVFEGLRQPLSFNMNDVSGLNKTEMVNYLTERVFQQYPDMQHKELFGTLHSVIHAVGLETLKKVTPTVDYRFIQHYTQEYESGLSRAQVMKLFPHIKGPVLEDELGL
jgi:hypothetical protein